MADILVLWVLLLVCTVSFYRTLRIAGYLLVPYLGWVSLVSFRNCFIVHFNPEFAFSRTKTSKGGKSQMEKGFAREPHSPSCSLR